jgi:hypothetical protein
VNPLRRAILALLLTLLATPAHAGRADDIAARWGTGRIRGGARPWSAAELETLDRTLGRLDPLERKALVGVQLRRQATSPRPGQSGVFRQTRRGARFISIFDPAFRADRDSCNHTIAHEVGHAVSAWSLRRSEAAMRRAVDAYNTAVDASNAAVTRYNALVRRSNTGDRAARDSLPVARQRLESAKQKAADRLPAVTSSKRARQRDARDFARGSPRRGVFAGYRKALAGKRGPTRYGRRNLKESFAESFALFRCEPKTLDEKLPRVLRWFRDGGHLQELRP